MSQYVSSRWYPTLQTSHDVAFQFIIQQPGSPPSALYESPVFVNPGVDPYGTDLSSIIPNTTTTPGIVNPIVSSGNVTTQKQQDVRSTLTMTLYDPSNVLVPSGILSPWGNEMIVKKGLAYPDGTYELLQLGVFRITDVDPTDSGDSVKIEIQGEDRSRIVARDQVLTFYQTAENQAYSDAMRAIVTNAYSLATFNDTAANWYNVPPAGINIGGISPNMIYTPTIYGITYQEGDDLWTEARNMAASLACDFYTDRFGVFTFEQDANLNYMNAALPIIPSPIFTFNEGETTTMTAIAETLSDRDAYNAWVITGEGQVIGYTQAPLTSYPPVYDNDPNSPTYYLGPYGVVSGFETNDYMVTVPQINTYANYKLATSIGKQQSLQISAFCDTSLDLDDPIAVTRERLGIIDNRFIIDQLTWPFEAGKPMTVVTRERRALSYGV